MRSDNKKSFSFKGISVIDITIVVVILLLVLGTVYKFKGLDKTSTSVSTIPVTYNVEVKKIRPYVFENVKEGDVLYDKTSGNPIGTIKTIKSTKAQEAMATLDGNVALMDVENRVDVVLVVEADATKSGDGTYYINRTYEVMRNSSKKFMTKYFECSGIIREIYEQ
ncbi:MAG: DUF4330 family protein [Tyzzerella sp.]|uniref:DUF4330 family protein n=1 Tax=Candidatus Fimicola merdigallinarum TaxID=2840819 RepID=A0A9D9H111_9FIRM|nr:DUF4330 family protein [Candidatus Fimicola merdigallinarum]